MLLKEVPANSAKHTIGFRCGDCIHFAKYPRYEHPCKQLGVTPAAKAPACFSPNVFALQKTSPDVLSQLGLLLKDFTATEARVLLGLLMRKKSLLKLGLRFGQRVYFRLFQADYVSNYYSGFVVGVSTFPTQEVYISSDLDKRQVGKPAIVALAVDSVYTYSQYKQIIVKLSKAGKAIDPNHPERKLFEKSKKPIDVGYEPPTLYTAKASWYTAYQRDINKDLRPLDEARPKSKAKKGKTKFTFNQGK